MRKPFGGNQIFIIFLIIMVFNAFRSGRFSDPGQWLLDTLMILPAIVIAITFHEFMHAFSAYKLGDRTPKAQGRVTLNPISHIDPIGIIALIFVGFGWGRPVQVNRFAFRGDKRLASLIVAVAGVAANFVLAVVFTFVHVALFPYPFVINTLPSVILFYIIHINLVLMLFNLLPIPPLDGFGIITEIFDLRRFSWYRPFYDNGFIILLVLIIFGLIGTLLGPGLSAIRAGLFEMWRFVLL